MRARGTPTRSEELPVDGHFMPKLGACQSEWPQCRAKPLGLYCGDRALRVCSGYGDVHKWRTMGRGCCARPTRVRAKQAATQVQGDNDAFKP